MPMDHFNLPPAAEVSLEGLPRATSGVPVGEDAVESPALHTAVNPEGGETERERARPGEGDGEGPGFRET